MMSIARPGKKQKTHPGNKKLEPKFQKLDGVSSPFGQKKVFTSEPF